MRNTWNHIRQNLRSRLAEWITSWGLLVWGIIMISEPHLYQLPTFSSMQSFAPQWVWGGGAMLVATMRLFFLTINGWWRPSAHLRALGAFLSILGWTAIFISYINLPYWTPALASMGTLMAIDFTSLWFASEDAKRADLAAKENRGT